MGRGVKELPAEMTGKTFRWFTQNVFVPDRNPRWRETTAYTVKYYLDTKLYPVFGDTALEDMTDAAMQAYLNKLAATYSLTVVQHCLLYLRAILSHATDEGVLTRNPARKLQMPDVVKREDRPYLPLADYNKLLAAMPSKRDQVMVKLLYLGGLRRGELFAVRWGDFTGSTISIHRQINRFGNETTVKTKASEAPVSLPEDVCDDLNEWRKWCSDTKPEAFMFASRNGSPINYKNWLERVLKPAATAAGVERITYHMFRRGLATEAHQLHIVDKNVQSQLRHANVKTTVDLYTRGVPAEQAKAMQQLSDASAR
jgi:integrase